MDKQKPLWGLKDRFNGYCTRQKLFSNKAHFFYAGCWLLVGVLKQYNNCALGLQWACYLLRSRFNKYLPRSKKKWISRLCSEPHPFGRWINCSEYCDGPTEQLQQRNRTSCSTKKGKADSWDRFSWKRQHQRLRRRPANLEPVVESSRICESSLSKAGAKPDRFHRPGSIFEPGAENFEGGCQYLRRGCRFHTPGRKVRTRVRIFRTPVRKFWNTWHCIGPLAWKQAKHSQRSRLGKNSPGAHVSYT